MTSCCEDKSDVIERLHGRQSRTLKIVLTINVALFAAELTAGLMSGSTALMGDSLDNLGDALAYGLSLYAVGRDGGVKARVAIFKAAMIFIAGVFVLTQVLIRAAAPSMPVFETMGIMSAIAMLANGTCLLLLTRYRDDDVNMRSVWECSRNDIASNASVLVAGLGVWLTSSAWPDLAVGLALAALFLYSSGTIFRDALRALKIAEGTGSNLK
ncbi:MAG: cation transporter [Burkholderiales bacterium]